MREQLSYAELERVLVEIGQQLDYPPTPDLAAKVQRRLAVQEMPAPARVPWAWALRWPSVRRWALALVALLVAAAALLAFSPEARSVVAQRLGLRGVVITQVSAVTPLPVGGPLNLGRPTTLEAAASAVAWRIEVPQSLGAPDEVYLTDLPPGGQVALVYRPRPDLPAASTTGVGVLITEFQASLPGGAPVGKGLPPGTRLESVTVNAREGYWMEGALHVMFMFQNTRGQYESETTRLAANVLLWEDGPLTLRLEGAMSKDAALAIAASTH